MSGKVRLGIIAASLLLTTALTWGGAGLTMLFMRSLGEHPDVAKAMMLLPAFMLPIVALVLHHRRSRAALSA